MPWRTNIVLLCAVEVGYMAVLAAATSMPAGVALTLFAIGFLGTLPTAALFLVLVSAIPPEWSRGRKRLAALVLSPVAAGFFVPLAFVGASWLLAVLLVGTTIYGALVRVPPRRGLARTEYLTSTR